MSSSSKKKLRKEQAAAQLTQKQLAAQKEAKKLKQMTLIFVVVVALVLAAAVTVLSIRAYNNSGIRERNTVALTIGDHEITAAEFNYYYYDAVNGFYTQFSSYDQYAADYAKAMYGIDMTLPLDEQIYSETDNTTWADYFIGEAEYSAKSVYALYDEATKNNFTLSEEEQSNLEKQFLAMEAIATEGYEAKNMKDYLKGMYGPGADVESYKEYYTMSAIAESYGSSYQNSVEYTEAEYRAHEAGKEAEYNSYSYATYLVSRGDYLTGGTKNEDGTTTYSDDDYKKAEQAAKKAAEELAEKATSIKAFNDAVLKMDVNADSDEEVLINEYTEVVYSSVTSYMRDWICDASREQGDTTIIENTTDIENEDGTTTKRLNGYYVIFFDGVNDNAYPLANVRHFLLDFEGGTTDKDGNVTYSDEDKAATMKSAQALLDEWKAGEATEESFAALANEKSTDLGSNTNGGLYEDIYPGETLEEFNEWVFTANRKAGDTGVVQTTEGCHIMYYSGDSELTFRDFMIKNELLSAHITEWQNNLVDSVTVVRGDLSLMNTDMVMLPS